MLLVIGQFILLGERLVSVCRADQSKLRNGVEKRKAGGGADAALAGVS